MRFPSALLFAIGILLPWPSCLGSRVASFDFTRHLGTKSIYPEPPSESSRADGASIDSSPSSCELVQIQMIIRHGTRNPGRSDILSFKDIEGFLRTQRPAAGWSRYPWMQNWTSPFQPEDESLLTRSGEEQLYRLGSRLADRFQAFLEPYSPNLYDFRASDKSRTVQSAQAFAFGLFRRPGAANECPRPATIHCSTLPASMDYEIEPAANCKAWEGQVLNSTRPSSESAAWRKRFLPDITARVQDRAGIPFTNEHVSAMFKLCAFQVAVQDIRNEWCSLFSEDDFQRLDYADDLKHWMQFSYSFPINRVMACSLATNIANGLVEAIDALASNRQRRLGIFRFGHSETLLFLFTQLGLYEDTEPLTANMTRHLLYDRQFRTAAISPFGSNVLIELVHCPGSEPAKILANAAESQESLLPTLPSEQAAYWSRAFPVLRQGHTLRDYAIRVSVNEQYLHLPRCQAKGEDYSPKDVPSCRLDRFFESIARKGYLDCDYSGLCGITDRNCTWS
ncbi:histidine phosphatase superfamily [Polychytrium aggregatum]|uniref:histidine phosphatase superfamily n=1 Tax=Polychytrium aggregatum TaxID=110093 RepID=UPI0022FE990A|nr:histidine phosphatase superfamily [Polychytrium aggregatum]KAI9209385.1 histidine phosphatase superfamily [Polychytrium aggregatum]